MDSRTRRDLDWLILNTVRIRASERLLFVECGDGWIVEEAWRRARRGYTCGLDRSSALVAQAVALRSVLGVLEFRTWDGQHIPWPARFFHRVVSTFALQGSADSAGLVRELRGVLRPGGHLYLIERNHSPEHGGDFASPNLELALRRAGFDEARELTQWQIGQGVDPPASGVILVARTAALTACS